MSVINFEKPEILKRTLSDVELQRKYDIAEYGKKVQLGEKTLDQLLSVVVPDPNNPNVKIQKRINIGEASTNITNMLKAINESIRTGNIDTTSGFINVVNRLGDITSNLGNIINLDQEQTDLLRKNVEAVARESTVEEAGLQRTYNYKGLEDNSKEIAFYIFSNFRKNLNIKESDPIINEETGDIIEKGQKINGFLTSIKPIFGIATTNIYNFIPISLTDMANYISQESFYLDLKYLTVLPNYLYIEDGLVKKREVPIEEIEEKEEEGEVEKIAKKPLPNIIKGIIPIFTREEIENAPLDLQYKQFNKWFKNTFGVAPSKQVGVAWSVYKGDI